MKHQTVTAALCVMTNGRNVSWRGKVMMQHIAVVVSPPVGDVISSQSIPKKLALCFIGLQDIGHGILAHRGHYRDKLRFLSESAPRNRVPGGTVGEH